ncbi:protein DMR6-LIKE OXYGENASE 1 [Selaginella moellendorffii]|uniref:protein DMR6-LIKE OXYGENASE 1 n=1 Tax=Selaginella moellendorffii TaxID=88036 RepID=UPI000D1C8A92|nr:protein DMR6-LIKE OXYGENASE 1 [Selaginella moellendorffii]|eukprot:XP_024522044.1 protein DMR6-LIKE OXYGENASE 1 [Selaginella moellendorffii]
MGTAANLDAILGESLTIEDYYVTDPGDRPTVPHNAYDDASDTIPCLHLARIRASSGEDRKRMLEEVRDAVCEWGFFRVVAHGVDEKLVDDTVAWARGIFDMDLETKLKSLVDDSSGSLAGYHCGVVKQNKSWQESFHSWADPSDFKIAAEKLWPSSEEIKEMHYKFSMAMEELALEILQLLEETLGVTSGDFTRHWERLKRTLVRFNWYPPCEEPGLVLGAGSHTDPDIITILLQDEVGGLQLLKDSKWIACKPLHGSFVVNVGDCLQVLSNDFLPSLQHRAVLNKEKARLSVVTFVLPKVNATIEPSSHLVDEDHPAAFRRLMFEEIINAAKEMKFKGKEVLSLFRV